MQFKPMYPDVLGAVTGGPRVSLGMLQLALGIFPQQAFLNQPIEVVLVLQNMVDQPMQVKVSVRVPATDKKGHPVIIETARNMVTLGLRPGEAGVLRMPMVAYPPTHPGKGFPVRVAVRYRTPEDAAFVRPPSGGPPPSVLEISPFRLQVLREIEFKSHKWNESAELVTAYFDIAPKRMPSAPQSLKHTYETLWTQEHMVKEAKLAQNYVEDARRMAVGFAHRPAYYEFIKIVGERFAERDMPLHPGEITAIAKMMAYTVDEAPQLETGFRLDNMRWFQALVQLLAHNQEYMDMDRGQLLVRYLFPDVLYDSVLMAFSVIQSKVEEDLGDHYERINYANRVLTWYAGHSKPDLNYIYLPLVMGGVVINRLVMLDRSENPWRLVDDLREAYRGRVRLASGESVVIFNMLNELLDAAAQNLRESRVPRP